MSPSELQKPWTSSEIMSLSGVVLCHSFNQFILKSILILILGQIPNSNTQKHALTASHYRHPCPKQCYYTNNKKSTHVKILRTCIDLFTRMRTTLLQTEPWVSELWNRRSQLLLDMIFVLELFDLSSYNFNHNTAFMVLYVQKKHETTQEGNTCTKRSSSKLSNKLKTRTLWSNPL